MDKKMDVPKDRDYFFDTEDNIYQVLGYCHPDESIHCLRKYTLMDKKLENHVFYWSSELTGKKYTRNIPRYSVETAHKNIREHKYAKLSDYYGADFILFPKSEIDLYLSPQRKLNDLLVNFKKNGLKSLSDKNSIIRDALEVVFLFEDELNIPPNNIGLTGSSLWDAAHENSDIDIVIYGIDNVRRFLNNIDDLIKKNSRLRRLTMSEIIQISNGFSQKTGLSVDDCTVYTSKKKYLQYYNKIFLSIAFSPLNEEIKLNPLAMDKTTARNTENYERIKIEAEVGDLSWGYFYPAVIPIKNVEVLSISSRKSIESNNITRILIWEREISGYFDEGDIIEVQGLLQSLENLPNEYISWNNQIESIPNRNAYQIVIGTSENYGNEYIKNYRL